MEGGGSGTLENPSEMLPKAALLLLLYPPAQVLRLGNHVVVFRSCGLIQRMLYGEGGPLRFLGTACSVCCGCHQPVLRRSDCCSGFMDVILVRLGCWVSVLACSSERIGCCWKPPANNTRNLFLCN